MFYIVNNMEIYFIPLILKYYVEKINKKNIELLN